MALFGSTAIQRNVFSFCEDYAIEAKGEPKIIQTSEATVIKWAVLYSSDIMEGKYLQKCSFNLLVSYQLFKWVFPYLLLLVSFLHPEWKKDSKNDVSEK